jgi:hypothetical protein
MPLASSCLADSILLSVIRRFLPPTRPRSLAAANPARVRSTISSLWGMTINGTESYSKDYCKSRLTL